MGDDFAVAGVALSVVMALALGAGTVLLIRDTVRKRGRWGINQRPVHCPECGEPAPVVRWPRNWRQALWGGCNCKGCGTEYDKWGQPVGGGQDA